MAYIEQMLYKVRTARDSGSSIVSRVIIEVGVVGYSIARDSLAQN